jgi:hypothetical protein
MHSRNLRSSAEPLFGTLLRSPCAKPVCRCGRFVRWRSSTRWSPNSYRLRRAFNCGAVGEDCPLDEIRRDAAGRGN